MVSKAIKGRCNAICFTDNKQPCFWVQTSEVKARLWVPQKEHWTGSQDNSFSLQATTDLLHELRHVPYSPGLQRSLSVAVLNPGKLSQKSPDGSSRSRSSLSAPVSHFWQWSVPLTRVMDTMLLLKPRREPIFGCTSQLWNQHHQHPREESGINWMASASFTRAHLWKP